MHMHMHMSYTQDRRHRIVDQALGWGGEQVCAHHGSRYTSSRLQRPQVFLALLVSPSALPQKHATRSSCKDRRSSCTSCHSGWAPSPCHRHPGPVTRYETCTCTCAHAHAHAHVHMHMHMQHAHAHELCMCNMCMCMCICMCMCMCMRMCMWTLTH